MKVQRFTLSLALTLFPAVAHGAGSPPPATQPVNLIFNGSFEKPDARGKLPDGWTTEHPDNLKLITDPSPQRGNVIQMTAGKGLLSTYGVDLLSSPVKVKANTYYHVTGLTKSDGPSMMMFVKGYAQVTRMEDGKPHTFDDAVYQMRKEIKPSEDWQSFDLKFSVIPSVEFSRFQHEIKYVRVLLWEYMPKGSTVWWDEIRFTEAQPVPEKDRRIDKLVTQVGTKARLSPAATQPDESQQSQDKPDVEQLSLDALNAWQDGKFEDSLAGAQKALALKSDDPEMLLLAARTCVKLEKWDQGKKYAVSVLGQKGEAWRGDWARVVKAHCDWKLGDAKTATASLRKLIDQNASDHAVAEAKKLLEEMGK